MRQACAALIAPIGVHRCASVAGSAPAPCPARAAGYHVGASTGGLGDETSPPPRPRCSLPDVRGCGDAPGPRRAGRRPHRRRPTGAAPAQPAPPRGGRWTSRLRRCRRPVPRSGCRRCRGVLPGQRDALRKDVRRALRGPAASCRNCPAGSARSWCPTLATSTPATLPRPASPRPGAGVRPRGDPRRAAPRAGPRFAIADAEYFRTPLARCGRPRLRPAAGREGRRGGGLRGARRGAFAGGRAALPADGHRPGVRIVPVLVGADAAAQRKLAEALASSSMSARWWWVSTDLAHYPSQDLARSPTPRR